MTLEREAGIRELEGKRPGDSEKTIAPRRAFKDKNNAARNVTRQCRHKTYLESSPFGGADYKDTYAHWTMPASP